jgi:hypothetical protein
MDDDGQALKKAEITAVRRMQAQFSGRILRRTTDSVNWKGKPLLDLPPHKVIIGILKLTGRELEIIQKRAEDARGRHVYHSSVPCHPWPSPSHRLLTVLSAITANETGRFFQTRVRFVDQHPFPRAKRPYRSSTTSTARQFVTPRTTPTSRTPVSNL